MKLKPMTVYHTKDGYWLYTGFFKRVNFRCDGCDKPRACHEFLLYPELSEIYSDKASNDFGRWVNTARYGNTCAKAFVAMLENELIEVITL